MRSTDYYNLAVKSIFHIEIITVSQYRDYRLENGITEVQFISETKTSFLRPQTTDRIWLPLSVPPSRHRVSLYSNVRTVRR